MLTYLPPLSVRGTIIESSFQDSPTTRLTLQPLSPFHLPLVEMASAEEITTFHEFHPDDVQVIARRPPRTLEIVEPRPSWASDFRFISERVRAALGDRALKIEHVGSTSVPGLPAKPIFDVDIIVRDPTDEDSYVADLEAAGFVFLFREPPWYEHRFFGLVEPYANIHVFGPAAAEHARHLIFRDWLREHADDQLLYAQAKREAAEASRNGSETVYQYTLRKEDVLKGILHKAFVARGLLPPIQTETK